MATFDYTKLRSLERRERQSPELMNIGDDFFEKALGHIRQLKARLEQERQKNPSSKKVLLISDELRNTERIWKSIFERREKKVVQAALSAARGGSHTPKYLTRQERRFYDRLVALLRENRERILEGETSGDAQPAAASSTDGETRKEADTAPPPEEKEPETRPADETGGAEEQERDVTLRMLQDMPSFVGSDMNNYALEKEDVVVLPEKTAAILVERGAAEQITVDWPQ